MRRMIVLLIMLFAVFPVSSYAGGGEGEYEVTEIVIRTNAIQTFEMLVRKGKVDASWADVKPEKAIKRMKDKYNGDWLVAFLNPAEKDKEKQTLYG